MATRQLPAKAFVQGGLFVCLGLLGCGSTEGQGPPGAAFAGAPATAGVDAGGSRGGGTWGGSSGGGGDAGAGGALVSGNSVTEACIAYVLAVCARFSACALGSGACVNTATQCPDVVASPGSTRTVADLRACARAYQELPCEQLQLGVYPACATPGTRALGESCLFTSQCRSLSCAGTETCRQCVPLSHQGESCADNESCAGLLTCTLGKCELPEGTPAPPKEFPTLGMSCADARACVGDSYCELDDLTCKALPENGSPCGVDAATQAAGPCTAPFRCNRSSATVGTCERPPQMEETCLLNPETGLPEDQPCDPSSRCDATRSPPICLSKLEKGQACTSDQDCPYDTACVCADGPPTCSAKVCGQIQVRGPCASPGDICHPGSTCNAGRCEPRDSQGLFAATCGP